MVIDNAYRGITPVTFRDIPAGSHAVTFRISGYEDYTTVATVSGGAVINVPATLTLRSQQGSPAAPLPTRSPLSGLTVAAAIGISAASFMLVKRK